MSSSIEIGDWDIWVSNMMVRSLISCAIDVGSLNSNSDVEMKHVDGLSNWYNNDYWTGCDVDMLQLFPTEASKAFWSKVFLEISKATFLREKGDTGESDWQSQKVSHALAIHFHLNKEV